MTTNRLIGLVGRVFANGPGDLGSIPGCIIPKTLKMVLDTSLLNTQQYKERIKGKVEQFRERSSALPYTSVLLLLKRGPSGRSRLRSPTYMTAGVSSSLSKTFLWDMVTRHITNFMSTLFMKILILQLMMKCLSAENYCEFNLFITS